jgi:hypothetical protein
MIIHGLFLFKNTSRLHLVVIFSIVRDFHLPLFTNTKT